MNKRSGPFRAEDPYGESGREAKPDAAPLLRARVENGAELLVEPLCRPVLEQTSEIPALSVLQAPERKYDCPHYDSCLGLAAALDWPSFTCSGCDGRINQQLIWRAHHHLRSNPGLSALCNLPSLRALPEEES
jgi:hypothetical protein